MYEGMKFMAIRPITYIYKEQRKQINTISFY